MGKKKVRRTKHIPQRTCIGCRSVSSKREMIRLVKTDDGILADPTGKMPGRGVYLHNRQTCWESGLNSAIARGLMTDLTEEDRIYLKTYLENEILDGDGKDDHKQK